MEDYDARVRRIVREEINRFRRRVMLCAWVLFFVMLIVGLVIHCTEVVGLAALGIVVTPFLLLLR